MHLVARHSLRGAYTNRIPTPPLFWQADASGEMKETIIRHLSEFATVAQRGVEVRKSETLPAHVGIPARRGSVNRANAGVV